MDLWKLSFPGWPWNARQQPRQQPEQQHPQQPERCECHQVQTKLADMVAFLGGNPAHMPGCLCALEKLIRPRLSTYADSGDDEIDTAIILDGLDHHGKHYKLPDAFRLRKTVVCTPGDLLHAIRPRAYVVITCNFSQGRLVAPAHRPRSAPPRPIPERFDTSMAVEWLRQCRSRHKECSGGATYGLTTGRPASTRRVQVPGFRLIDCETRRIVAVPGYPAYLALSYVWRLTFPPTPSRPQKIDSPAGLSLPSSTPQVIQDAIVLTRLLGVRYLWVDRYCIDDGDPRGKLAQIRRMHHIYRGAELTIVAAASGDGLPGMGGLARPAASLPAGEEDEEFVVTILPGHPSHAIQKSEWASRAWTYQEAALSRRRLVFGDAQVYYDCARTSRWESLEHLTGKRDSRPARPSVADQVKADSSRHQNVSIRDRLFGRDENPEGRPPPIVSCPDSVITAIENFTRRKLSFDDDSLNAFSGILANFQSLQPNLAHVWGIPYPLHPRRPPSGEGEKQKGKAVAASELAARPYEAGSRSGSATTEPSPARTSGAGGSGGDMLLIPPRYRLQPGVVRSIRDEEDTGRLVRLCWAHRHSRWDPTPSHRPRRRPQFPSWSWVGWDGAVVWLPASGTFEKYPHTDTDEAVELSYAYCRSSCSATARTTQVDEAVVQEDDAGATSHFPDALRLRAWSVPVSRLAFSREDKESADGDGAVKWMLGDMVVSLSLSHGPATPELFVDEAKRGVIRIYWLATTSLWMNPERARCIVVERREGARATRIGSLIVHCNGRPLRSLEMAGDEPEFQLEEVMLF